MEIGETALAVISEAPALSVLRDEVAREATSLLHLSQSPALARCPRDRPQREHRVTLSTEEYKKTGWLAGRERLGVSRSEALSGIGRASCRERV